MNCFTVNCAACDGVNDLRYSNDISLLLVSSFNTVAFVLCTKATLRINKSDKIDVPVMVFEIDLVLQKNIFIACLYHKNTDIQSPLMKTQLSISIIPYYIFILRLLLQIDK